MSLPVEALPPDARLLIPHYDLLDELGRGGMAVVYLARERATGEEVAIKLVDARLAGDVEAAQRFAREAYTVARLRHPNLVRTLHVETLGGRAVAIVNAYIRGRTLRAVLRAAGALRFEVAIGVLRDVASGLAHAHDARVVHRDVKPENIFLEDGTDRGLLADFGIARPLDGDSQLTVAGAAVGTPTYMAPEQVDGLAPDPRTDVYALGLVGWEMISGRRPWQGESLYGVLHHQKHDRLPSLASIRPDIPAFLLAAIEGALHKAPEDRWRDAGEFLAQLTPRPIALPTVVGDTDETTTLRRVVPPPAVAAPPVVPLTPNVADAPIPAAAAAQTPASVPAPARPPRVHAAPRIGRRGALLLAAAAALLLLVAVLALRGTDGADRPRTADATAADSTTTGRGDTTAPGTAGDATLDSLLSAAMDAVGHDSATAGAPVAPLAPPARTATGAAGDRARMGGTAAGDVRLTSPGRPASRPSVRAPAPPAPAAARAAPTAATRSTTAPTATDATLDARCRSALSADQRSCLLGQLASSDAELNAVYGQLIGVLRRRAGGAREPRAVRALRVEQRAWLVTRDRACRDRTRSSEGPLWGVSRAPCFAELSQQRAAALARRLPSR